MGPSVRVLRSAFVLSLCAGAIAGVWPAAAQQYEASLRSLDYAPDPLERSPRLLGMGRLTLADDLHNRINLWDFAGSPTGIAAAESVTTFEYRPIIRSSASLRDIGGQGPVRERQELSARQVRHGLETWRRAGGSTAYGLVAEVATLQVDRPYGESVARRGKFTVPGILGAVNGRVPWLKSDRFDYALRLEHSLENLDEFYYEFHQLPQGEYLAREGAIVAPPDLFTPTRIETSKLRGGVALSMRVTNAIRVALGYDRARLKVKSGQQGLRSTSELDERRPFQIGQASLVGRFGPFEWGVDGRAWQSRSQESFFWSVSAGPIQDPLTGRGKRLDREVEGSSLRTRARWASGAFELDAGFGTAYRRTIITPWYPVRAGDQPGFNDFLSEVAFRGGADTLLLPERVRPSRVEERAYELTGGGSWSLPRGRGVVGAEVHHRRGRSLERTTGAGPAPKGWDVRAGGEYHLNASLRARAGWSYGIDDRDFLTAADEYRRAIATTGVGYQPQGANWSVDLGYVYEWVYTDFVDPARSRGNRQQLAVQMRWPF